MKTLFALLTACLISIIPLKAHDFSPSIGITAGPSILFNEYGKGLSTEYNLTFMSLNLGGNIQFQDEIKPKYNLYIGLGFLSLLQFQYGTDFSASKFRIQSLLPILSETLLHWKGFDDRYDDWSNRINLHLFYENNISDSKMSNFGIGIQFLIL